MMMVVKMFIKAYIFLVVASPHSLERAVGRPKCPKEQPSLQPSSSSSLSIILIINMSVFRPSPLCLQTNSVLNTCSSRDPPCSNAHLTITSE